MMPALIIFKTTIHSRKSTTSEFLKITNANSYEILYKRFNIKLIYKLYQANIMKIVKRLSLLSTIIQRQAMPKPYDGFLKRRFFNNFAEKQMTP